jgi:Zn-dependent protease
MAANSRTGSVFGLGNGFRAGHVAGIEVRLDWSLVIVFVLIASTLAGGLFPAWHPDWSVAQSVLTALGAAVLFLVSVLLHELSHAIVGRRRGIGVRCITLFVFGGIAQMESEPKRWRDELWMTIVGPLTSMLIGGACLWIATAIAGREPDFEDPRRWLAGLGALPTLLVWLGQINLVLALFNLVPAFPLDGGRVLRATLWGVSGDLRRATRWASMGGQAFAWALMAVGFAIMMGADIPPFGGGLLSGLWLAFIGWFLNNAAVQSYRQLIVQETLRDLPVSRLMQTDLAVVPVDLEVERFVDEHLLRSPQQSFPVMSGDELAGLVTLDDVRRLERARWRDARLAEIMTPRGQLVTVNAQDDALEAIAALGRGQHSQGPVLDRGRLVGLLRLQDIPRWLALHDSGDEAPRHSFAR